MGVIDNSELNIRLIWVPNKKIEFVKIRDGSYKSCEYVKKYNEIKDKKLIDESCVVNKKKVRVIFGTEWVEATSDDKFGDLLDKFDDFSGLASQYCELIVVINYFK